MYSLWESTSENPREDEMDLQEGTSVDKNDLTTVVPKTTNAIHPTRKRQESSGMEKPEEEYFYRSKPAKDTIGISTKEKAVGYGSSDRSAENIEKEKDGAHLKMFMMTTTRPRTKKIERPDDVSERTEKEKQGSVPSQSRSDTHVAMYVDDVTEEGNQCPGAVAVRGPAMDDTSEQDEESESWMEGSSYRDSRNPPHSTSYERGDTPVLEARAVERDDPSSLVEEVRHLREEMARGIWIPEGENVVAAQPMPKVGPSELETRRRRRRWIVLASVLVVLVGVGVALGVVLSGDDGPKKVPVEQLLRENPLVDNDSLDDPESPQYKAMVWLENNNTYIDEYPDWQRLQRFTLATLYFSTDGDNWHENGEWLTDEDVCRWYNVAENRCNDGEKLARLKLEGNNLNGTLPKELGLLSDSLLTIALPSNALVGTIPSEIGLMRRLEQLWFQGNSLTGSIPTEIGDFKIMKEFFLEENELTGPIPTEIGNLAPHLGRILFGNNLLNSTIPTELGRLPALQMLRMGNNDFTGTIPTELGLLTNQFVWLNVQDSALTGSIPNEIGNLATLEKVELQNNLLTGTIPEATTRLPLLERLILYNNSLTGNYTCAPTVGACMISCDNSSVACRSL